MKFICRTSTENAGPGNSEKSISGAQTPFGDLGGGLGNENCYMAKVDMFWKG